MKREILCPPCGAAFQRIMGTAKREVWDPPEWHKWASGKLLHSCVCDHCNKPMDPGDEAKALSISLLDDIGDWWTGEYLAATERRG